MRPRRTALIVLTGLALAGLGGGAIAATSGDPRQEFLENAAQRLGVSPEKLEEALEGAREEVFGARPHRGFGHGPGAPHLRHHGGPHHILDAITETLGVTPRELFEAFRDGKSLEDVAEEKGKSLADVKKAVREAAAEDLDEAVADGRLTREQADEMLDHVVERVEHFGERRPPRFHHRFRGRP